jgi:hypothetical protein
LNTHTNIVLNSKERFFETVEGGNMAQAQSPTRTTTVRLPRRVYDEAKCVVNQESGGTNRVSLNDLIVAAITAYLKVHKRRQIDAAFAGMAEDADYQKEAKLLTEDSEYSDWEAIKLGEDDLIGEPENAASSSR